MSNAPPNATKMIVMRSPTCFDIFMSDFFLPAVQNRLAPSPQVSPRMSFSCRTSGQYRVVASLTRHSFDLESLCAPQFPGAFPFQEEFPETLHGRRIVIFLPNENE